MDPGKSLEKIISFSFIEWLKNKKMQKYLAISIIINLAMMFISIISAAHFFSGITDNTSFMEVMLILINYTIFFIILILPLLLVMILLNYLIIAKGLELSKKKNIGINLIRFIKYLFYPLFSMVVAMLSLYNLKFLTIGIIGLIIMLVSFLLIPLIGLGAIPLSLIGMLILFVYGIVVIYNTFRLIIGEIIFIEKEESIMSSLKESWDKTNGEVFNIVIIIIVFVVVTMIISFISQIPLTIYSIVISLTSEIVGQTINDVAMMTNPIFIILMIPTYLVSAYLIIAGNLMVVGIYNSLKIKK